ncbi:basic blue protein-like [Magnolia sinica]|uniref:basic blue protein-like n=1 Tax=Magnolia sinica TaxID=86752 RepID=UPI00265B14D4|nr:basic blue protein-like [Magnolia sinica]
MARAAAAAGTIVGVVFLCLMMNIEIASAATYTVGDDAGWSYDVSPWPLGKNFKVGDVLVFNYKPWQHNVVVVNQAGFDNCSVPPGSKTYDTGADSIPVVKGYNFFISSMGNDCHLGLAMTLYAD